ncbi:hypothetical protein OCU04_011359 [Sclerotinia nivalis]|uniref:Uncharacterized protein n=1 Tax=Sclerotinia nivalis TaxID=352851 RepID=A0A9X0AF33_9HELO|nr:hypothetical protein OCU04_011359 [Sclerotinia nivalis]
MTRWENGHGTSSKPIPVDIADGANSSHLDAVYKSIWDRFIALEQSDLDRANLPLGSGPRQNDGIEGLSVNWQGNTGGEWAANEQTLITEKTRVGIWQILSTNPHAIIHCNVKDSKLGGIVWSPPKY